MPKQLINIIGIVVVAGILLVAVALGMVPQLSAAASTASQTDQVATTNAAYQARIDQLQKQKQNLPAIKATVAQLHRQIPAEYHLDDVFLLVSEAANTAKATITSVNAGEPTVFAERTAPVPAGQPAPVPSATPAPSPSGSPAATSAAGSAGSARGAASGGAAPAGRTQVPITIQVTVSDAAAAAKFLDGLRAGPRLLGNVTSTATANGSGLDLQVSALAFAQPSTATVAVGDN